MKQGKGELTTYWLVRDGYDSKSTTEQMGGVKRDSEHPNTLVFDEDGGKMERLINWNVDVLLRILRQVVARRESHGF